MENSQLVSWIFLFCGKCGKSIGWIPYFKLGGIFIQYQTKIIALSCLEDTNRIKNIIKQAVSNISNVIVLKYKFVRFINDIIIFRLTVIENQCLKFIFSCCVVICFI